ncbi:MAG TPA: murein L,D-transpeptidase, partial [Methylobacterium sp.]
MGASRSTSVAIAALVAGCVGYGAAARAQAPDAAAPPMLDPIEQTGAIGPPPRPAQPEAPPAVVEAPTPDVAAPAETPVAAPAPPPVPTDPQSAALAARLSDPAPLLPRLAAKEREAMQ